MYVPGAYAGEGEGGGEGGRGVFEGVRTNLLKLEHTADISMKGVHLITQQT